MPSSGYEHAIVTRCVYVSAAYEVKSEFSHAMRRGLRRKRRVWSALHQQSLEQVRADQQRIGSAGQQNALVASSQPVKRAA